MSEKPTEASVERSSEHASWMPMIVIALGQTLTALNNNTMPVSIGGIVNEFDVAPTTVGTIIVINALAVAGFIMFGAKLGQRLGSTFLFRAASVLLLFAAILTTFSPNITTMYVSQFLAGFGQALIGPTLVVLIAHNYSGTQKARALGMLGGVSAIASAAAFFLAGVLGSTLGWRYAFGFIILFAVLTLVMSFKLKPSPRDTSTRIDPIGLLLAVGAISLLSLGVNNINKWGLFLADLAAPWAPFGLSPAMLMVLAGLIGVQLFMAWAQRRQAAKLTPLLALEVIHTQPQKMTALSLMAIVTIGNALAFLIPMYIQMVQGRSSMDTAIALIPYQLAILASAMLVINLYDKFSPRVIAATSFSLVAVALILLATVTNNEWNNALVVVGLILVGIGQGALITLLFQALVANAPIHLAGDVGALRGAINNFSSGLGTALAAALLVGVLGNALQREVHDHPLIQPDLIAQVNLDRATFISNDHLREFMTANTSATPEQIELAVKINAEARLHALHIAFLFFAALSLLMILPSRTLPALRRKHSVNDELRRPVRKIGED